jgi:hypothetical protein
MSDFGSSVEGRSYIGGWASRLRVGKCGTRGAPNSPDRNVRSPFQIAGGSRGKLRVDG